jgi:hypothetical protein
MNDELSKIEASETELPGTEALDADGLEEFELTLNNMDGVEEYDTLMESEYEERTIYTKARSLEEATEKFTEYFDRLVETHGYNGVRPMTLWLFHRIQDGTRI